MRKLTFERAILIVLAMIMFISTTEIREKYTDMFIDKFLKGDKPVSANVQSGESSGFATMFSKADNLYNEEKYEDAASEYFALTLNALNIDQKSRANFRLGICQFRLKKYDLALKSFEAAIKFTPDDSVAYNNAAICAYRANDMKKAIEYQKKAIDILSVVEYYYNLATMYEGNEDYQEAANNFLVVAIGEQNITKVDRIDPVRVKEKVARLHSYITSKKVGAADKVFIALKLKDPREILTVTENEMKLKQGDFEVKTENRNGIKSINAQYDRKKYDPYNLIYELAWAVYKDGKLIYKKSADKISINAPTAGNYEIKLNIKYNGNKVMPYKKSVKIDDNKITVDKGSQDDITNDANANKYTRTYVYAVYEQLFENGFNIGSKGYTDRFNVVWGKDSGIETELNKNLQVDKATSLNIENTLKKEAGIWVNLDSLLKDTDIEGKTVNISFFARQITDDSDLNISVRIKTNNKIVTTRKVFELPFQFEEKTLRVYIPNDATGFTISIKSKPLTGFNIDRFTIVD